MDKLLKTKTNFKFEIYTNKSLILTKKFDVFVLNDESFIYHSKLIIIDDDIYIGSYNFNPFSEYYNREIMLKILNGYHSIKNEIEKNYKPLFNKYVSNNKFNYSYIIVPLVLSVIIKLNKKSN